MNRSFTIFAACLFTLSFYGCKKSINDEGNADQIDLLGDKFAPDGFDYATTKKIALNIRLLSVDDKPLKGVMVSVYSDGNRNKGSELTKVLSDGNGYVKTEVNVPSSNENLIIDAAYFGLLSDVKVFIKNNSVDAVIGGKSGASGNLVIEKANSAVASISRTGNRISNTPDQTSNAGTVYNYNINDFDALGRPLPSKLYAKDDIVWSDLMNKINYALPERKVVKEKYIKTEAPANLTITKLADVWITFVHEGADYRNSFGYYTYPTGHPPLTNADIDTVHLIFPNASLKLDNPARGVGNMIIGDKVKIGRFKPGTSIGFVLLQNAYKTNGQLLTTGTKFYSNETLNPEATTSLRRHNVIVHNLTQRTFLIGFEDINRTAGIGSDHDFNDLVVYAQASPVEAISPLDIPYLDETIPDSDGDGIPDEEDKYPADKDRAYDRYYPSENVWGTTAFEDLWPEEGDYDLNDLVVSYRYKFAMSSSNQVIDLRGEFLPLAAGALKQNGFGVQFPISPSLISSVSGYNLSTNSYIKLASNGVEMNQSKAVVIPFDNYKNLFGGADSFVNTNLSSPKINGQIVTLNIQFTNPLPEEFTVNAPFNPFLISNLDRGKEVHLINREPTSLALPRWFSTLSDFSRPLEGKYYLTKKNRPFGIDIFGPFNYPLERISVTEAYPHFAEWALSNGMSFSDWHSNVAGGYRNETAIYRK